MKNKLTKTKFRSVLGIAGKLFTRVACLEAVILICSSASAQNLFVSAYVTGAGYIYKFTWDGVQSTFASGLSPGALACDSAGNLFVAADYGTIYKYQPTGGRSVFASGLSGPTGLAFDSAGNLFVTNFSGGAPHIGTGTIYKFTPDGTQTTFAGDLANPTSVAIDRMGNLFVADIAIGNETIFKFTPDGVRSTFVSGIGGGDLSLACDSANDLFMSVRGTGVVRQGQHGDGYVDKFTPTGARSRFASHLNAPSAVVIDNTDNLFVEDGAAISSDETKYYPGAIYKFTPNGHKTTFAPGFDIGISLAWH